MSFFNVDLYKFKQFPFSLISSMASFLNTFPIAEVITIFGNLIIRFAMEKKPTIDVLYKIEKIIGINCWLAARDKSEKIINLGKELYVSPIFPIFLFLLNRVINSLSVKIRKHDAIITPSSNDHIIPS